MTVYTHQQLIHRIIKDLIVDIRFSTQMIKSSPNIREIQEEEAYLDLNTKRLKKVLRNRHTLKLNRYGSPNYNEL